METKMGGEMRKSYIANSSIISSLGFSTSENFEAIRSYVSNMGRFMGTPACCINRERLGLYDNFIQSIIYKVIEDVINESGIEIKAERLLVILSTTKGDIDSLNVHFQNAYLWDLSQKIEAKFQLHHKIEIVSNACVSGVAAIILADRYLKEGCYDHVIVVGVDTVGEFVVSGFNSFKSISPELCKPYDAARNGLTLGEAAAALLLTTDRDLSSSKIVISGGALSCDANHISGPSRTGDGLFFAIDNAMKQAGLTTVDFVNLHGTATVFNDEMESKAIDLAKMSAVPANSLKPYFGHTLGASGVLETIMVAEQMSNNTVFGVKGFGTLGTPKPINVCATHREVFVNHALKTASGFGGTNAAIVLSKEEKCIVLQKTKTKIEIEELAHVIIEKQQDADFVTFIRTEFKLLNDANLKFYKMDNLSKLGYVASCKLLKDIELNIPTSRIGLVIANSSSSLDTDIKHQKNVDEQLEQGCSPAVFVYTLANIVAAEIAIKHKLQGELMVFVAQEKSLNYLTKYSHELIENNHCDAVVLGWCELLGEDYNAELKLIKRK